MELLIKNVKLIDRGSELNGQMVDIFVKKGKIEQIGKNLKVTCKNSVSHQNLHVSIGWFDMHVNFRDPGFEYKEDLLSGTKAAVNGGFTGVGLSSATEPTIDSKSVIQYIKNKTANQVVDVFPYGTVSDKRKSENISEMFDMFNAGAVAFSDDKRSVKDSGLLVRALLYAKGFGGLVMNYPNDKTISPDGIVHEGTNSTLLGLKSIPALAEEIMVARDLFLVEYTGGRLHFSTISTTGAVNLIKQSKSKKNQITADVAAHYLDFDDSALSDFDTNYKVLPPFRTKDHIKSLIKGLKEDTIDVICSDHSPENIETKKVEFDFASFGISSIETMFGTTMKTLEKHLALDHIIEKISYNPRKILNLPIPSISVGELANLTFFDPSLEWTYLTKNSLSKSKNNPYFDKILKGKAIAVINNGQYVKCL